MREARSCMEALRMAMSCTSAVAFTTDYERLRGFDLVVEAATEEPGLKGRIFRQLADLAGPAAIFASNSSHLEPEVIFEGFADRSRALVTHYFFPADRNVVVEVIPAADTADGVAGGIIHRCQTRTKVRSLSSRANAAIRSM